MVCTTPVFAIKTHTKCVGGRGISAFSVIIFFVDEFLRMPEGDELTGRMLGAINSMLMEMMAAIARKDYEQRHERQAQGIEKAKAAGKYQGRPVGTDLDNRVRELLKAGLSIRTTVRHADCSTTPS